MMTDRTLDYIFNHVFLPTRVPGANDQGNGYGDRALADLLTRLAPLFRDANDIQYYQHWSTIHRTLRTFVSLHQHSHSLPRNALKRAFEDIRDGSGMVILNVAIQNSGLIIRKAADHYLVESFETSPPAATVLSSIGALQWDFPSRAVAVPATTFEDSLFQESFTDFLERASFEPVQQFSATTLKAMSGAYESRDTTTPAIIGQLLMSVLEANGHRHTATLTRKRIRDEVSWSDGAENPWRRSQAWLVLRVALQRCLCFLLGGIVGRVHYKFFMSFVMSAICRIVSDTDSKLLDRLAFARSKLANRVAKLQHEREMAAPEMSKVIASLFSRHEKEYESALRCVNDRLDKVWADTRARTIKSILPLPKRADPNSTVLSLSNSRPFLQRVLCEALYGRPPAEVQLEQRIRSLTIPANLTSTNALAVADYLNLADFESHLRLVIANFAEHGPQDQPDSICIELDQKLKLYQKNALLAYQCDPEQTSLMLLTIMELWQMLDALTIQCLPLLSEYDPGFSYDFLFCLQLSQLEDLQRLQKVEQYFEKRRRTANTSLPSIYGEVTGNSFMVRHFDRCPEMQALKSEIECADDTAKARKEEEWERESARYEGLMDDAAATACLFIEDENDAFVGRHDDRRCRKHYLERQANRMRISAHEAMLPNEPILAKAVVFELLLPKSYAAWRDALWRILKLGRQDTFPSKTPSHFLRDYQALLMHARPTNSDVLLASRTKSFMSTHYAQVRFPTSIQSVCVPHGPKYGLYDCENSLWTSQRYNKPNLAGLCAHQLPSNSVYATLGRYLHADFEGSVISGNDIIAKQTCCPNTLSMTEYTAFQNLRLGNDILWLNLLRELASPNLNFGAIEVGMLTASVALVAGPSEEHSQLRVNHWVFEDRRFCTILTEVIKQRLDSIGSNWREGNTIECMMTLLLRMRSLATHAESVQEAETLLLSIRTMTYRFVRLLRDEICNAKNVGTAQKRSQNALLAAMLARKTFIIEAAKSDISFDPDAITCFLECGFTIKDNLPKSGLHTSAKLSGYLRRLFIADLKLVHRVEHQLKQSINEYPEAVSRAVSNVWADGGGDTARTYSSWSFLPAPHSGWLTAQSTNGKDFRSQNVHLDLFGGTLLIDGQPLGRLPEDYTKQDFFRRLFGTRIFLTYPSNIYGMSYRLATLFEEHEIHFGFRGASPFIRARKGGRVLEWIPNTIFESKVRLESPDLPLTLIHDFVHWLDLGSQTLEIRPFDSMWQVKYSNWIIDLRNSVARRRNSLLVDPRSPSFNWVAGIIEPFEHRNNMTVFQPENANLSLHLPGLELHFRVNRNGLMESRQLKSAISLSQDAGTFYGLQNCLVLEDCIKPENRSVIVAMGPAAISWDPRSNHVRVQTNHTGYYASFVINKELGRLECAPESRLIYFKAYCHAVTASVLPDPLTERTGTDEALHCLRAGSAQPWQPVDQESNRLLSSIAQLTPQRLYYPESLKVIEKVSWQEPLMPAVQHEGFRLTVERILHQCRDLCRFHLNEKEPKPLEPASNRHLGLRALAKASIRHSQRFHSSEPTCPDQAYTARDCANSHALKNAYEVAGSVKSWSSSLAVTNDLTTSLQEWPIIQGFQNDFQLRLFADLIKIDLASCWGSLVRSCLEACEASDKFRFMFLFATMAFDVTADMTLIRSLIAITVMDDFKSIQLPQISIFKQFRGNQVPTVDVFMQLMNHFREPYPGDERSLLSIPMHPRQKHKLEMAQIKHEEISEESCKMLAKSVVSQWPRRELSMPGSDTMPLFDSVQALARIRLEWERLVDNHEFSRHLDEVQKILNTCRADSGLRPLADNCQGQDFYSPSISPMGHASLENLVQQPSLRNAVNGVFFNHQQNQGHGFFTKRFSTSTLGAHVQPSASAPILHSANNLTEPLIAELTKIVSPFTMSEDSVRKAYGNDLQNSVSALEARRKLQNTVSGPSCQNEHSFSPTDLAGLILSSRSDVQDRLNALRRSVADQNKWQNLGRLLPDLTPITLLESLPTIPRCCLAFKAILQFAYSIMNLQHLLRIQDAYLRQDPILLATETRFDGLTQRQMEEHIAWVLLQIDFNFLIRRDQVEVAQALVKPGSGSNSVLQMNMGQGKSSVVIPMLVAELANGRNLVRVVVPRPLLLQTGQSLQVRLGGLLGRKLRHVPFSRRTSTDMSNLKVYHSLHVDILKSHGLILTLPEHLLSFHLSGLQELSNGNLQQAKSMISLQEWFGRKCRDILDECDHMLAVKTQLIYPSGSQSMVDGHPSRWTLAEDLLKLVKTHVGELRRQHPLGIEVIERGPGTFPTIYLLSQSVKDTLLCLVTDSVIQGEGNILSVDTCSDEELGFVGRFLRQATFPKAVALQVAGVFKNNTEARQRLLLLRGLLVHRILLMGLSKRWNVQYGVDERRDPIAVPFQSKGIPSDHAEFGHPDVSILLTCLSFYYSGLTLSQFRQALAQMLKCDEPVQEFDSWMVEIRDFPDSLRSWSSINLEDEAQCAQLWSLLGRQMAVVNFFLNHSIFPRHARTFERKLVSSGWDIPLPAVHCNEKLTESLKENIQPRYAKVAQPQKAPQALTVGFSGTNDNKRLLPMNISQDDLPGLSHTNAEVLTYLLQPRNRQYFPAVDWQGRRLNERAFLHKVHSHRIRMLLDAGAQIIELENISLSRTWLEIDHEAEAAVFFGKDGRARVLYRDGKQQPLAGSPFLNNLGSCLVYLDEAHTRGVDLKMPSNAVAALTLGIMQTKDHTVQAAMRLRQLAVSQSVVFFAPPEVHQSILNFRQKTYKDSIDSHDVIMWLLEQTCCGIEQLQPLYISQGVEYSRRRISAEKNPDATSVSGQRKEYLSVLEQPEQYSLEKLYAPSQKTKARPVDATAFPEIAGFVNELELMKKDLRNSGDAVQALAHQEVEQEREVQIEVENVRELKKPSHAQALRQPPLQREIKSFVETGRLVAGSQAYQNAFVTLRQTALGRRLGISDSATASRLFVTQDFANTVVIQWSKPRDEYSRPVHWLLWSQKTDTALICSDYEADALLPVLRAQKNICTNLIVYAAPVTRAMIIFDTLRFYSVPSLPESWTAPIWLIRDLGIFAGRLYFDFQRQSPSVYATLGLSPPALPVPDIPTEADLWHELPFDESSNEGRKREPFSPQPLLFMQEWLAIRRKGQDFSQTMMGELCRGRRLENEYKGEVGEIDGVSG